MFLLKFIKLNVTENCVVHIKTRILNFGLSTLAGVKQCGLDLSQCGKMASLTGVEICVYMCCY